MRQAVAKRAGLRLGGEACLSGAHLFSAQVFCWRWPMLEIARRQRHRLRRLVMLGWSRPGVRRLGGLRAMSWTELDPTLSKVRLGIRLIGH